MYNTAPCLEGSHHHAPTAGRLKHRGVTSDPEGEHPRIKATTHIAPLLHDGLSEMQEQAAQGESFQVQIEGSGSNRKAP